MVLHHCGVLGGSGSLLRGVGRAGRIFGVYYGGTMRDSWVVRREHVPKTGDSRPAEPLPGQMYFGSEGGERMLLGGGARIQKDASAGLEETLVPPQSGGVVR